METELQMLRAKSTMIGDYHEYTSLRDIVLNPPLSQGISIRNALVKHAASAYVQSAFLTRRNRDGLAGLLARLRSKQSSFRACLHVIFQFVHRMMNGVGRVFHGRIMIRWLNLILLREISSRFANILFWLLLFS